jgi:hypothetical protein
MHANAPRSVLFLAGMLATFALMLWPSVASAQSATLLPIPIDPTTFDPTFTTTGHAFVAGGGQQAEPVCGGFGIAAHVQQQGSNAGPASGSLLFTCNNQPNHAVVTCLIVSGNQAFATATLDTGLPVVAHVVDNGDPVNGQPVDLLRFSFTGFIFPSAIPGCMLPILPPVPINSGNLVVRMASP